MRALLLCAAVLAALCGVMVARAGRPSAFDGLTFAHDHFAPESVHAWLCEDPSTCVPSVDAMQRLPFKELVQRLLHRTRGAVADLVRTHGGSAALHSWLPADVATALSSVHALATRENQLSNSGFVLQQLHAHRKAARPESASDDYPYFGFLPSNLGATVPGAATTTLSSPCFASIQLTSAWTADNASVVVSLAASGQTSAGCEDHIIMSAPGLDMHMEILDAAKSKQITMKINPKVLAESPALRWGIATKGVHLMRFRGTFLDALLDLLPTIDLLTGFEKSPIPNSTYAANFDFMRKYIERSPRMQPFSAPRTAGASVVKKLDPAYVQSGDSLIVVRYDGLDPMIGWGEGFTAGHSVIALREPVNNTLHVCESTAKDAYWPRNGIQCTPWALWMAQAEHAEYNVLLAPLAPKYAAKFNSTKAFNFFLETAGLDYGYLIFLWGWIDLRKGNFPCLPPDYKYCLTEPTMEMLAILWDRLVPTGPQNVFRQALNHRVGTKAMPIPALMQYAKEKKGWDFPDVYTKPELDEWRYETTRYGKPAVGRAMVCCVFVCHMWKHGGLFDEIDDDINCGEQTLWDIYSMQLFDTAKLGSGRPDVCKEADPQNQLCQLMGTHTFYAKPDFNTRGLYKQMGQSCSSECPDYVRKAGC